MVHRADRSGRVAVRSWPTSKIFREAGRMEGRSIRRFSSLRQTMGLVFTSANGVTGALFLERNRECRASTASNWGNIHIRGRSGPKTAGGRLCAAIACRPDLPCRENINRRILPRPLLGRQFNRGSACLLAPRRTRAPGRAASTSWRTLSPVGADCGLFAKLVRGRVRRRTDNAAAARRDRVSSRWTSLILARGLIGPALTGRLADGASRRGEIKLGNDQRGDERAGDAKWGVACTGGRATGGRSERGDRGR